VRSWSRTRAGLPLLPVLAVALLAGGCGGSSDAAVSSVSDAFRQALASQEGARACALLSAQTVSDLEQSSGKPCATAVLHENVPTAGKPTGVQVYGRMAQVRYADDTIFLSRFHDGWRLVGAGCRLTPGAAQRFDCQVKGA